MLQRGTLFVLPSVLSVGGFLFPLEAQVFYGTLVGTVTDSSGGAVPNADVTIVNPQTSWTRCSLLASFGLLT